MKKLDHKSVIRITTGDTSFTATMYENTAANDFISLLPLTLTLTDYAETEKISGLPKRLNTKDAPAGHKPLVGEITYYAPWGNLALFYKGFGYSGGLVPLGKIESGIEIFKGKKAITINIEQVHEG